MHLHCSKSSLDLLIISTIDVMLDARVDLGFLATGIGFGSFKHLPCLKETI